MREFLSKVARFASTCVFSFTRAGLAILPLRSALNFGARCGKVTGRFVPDSRRVALAQLQFARITAGDPGISPSGAAAPGFEEKMCNRVFAHVGESFVETLLMDRLFEIPLPSLPLQRADVPMQAPRFACFTSSGQDLVYELLRQGKGAIALSGHLGCFELLAAFHIRSHVPLAVIGRTPRYDMLSTFIDDVRSRYGAETIWREDPQAGRKIIRALKHGKIVAALIDQDTSLENEFAPFFGLPAPHPVALIKLAVSYELPIVTSFIVRLKQAHHHIFTERIEYNAKDLQACTHILGVFAERLETFVRRYPEQWLWWHRRWRREPGVNYTQSPEKLRSTGEYLQWLLRKGAGAATNNKLHA